jgi:plasmid stabilization system protein ParE
MEDKKELQIKLSEDFIIDLDCIYQYGVETFGEKQAIINEKEIWQLIERLSLNYTIYPECRYIPTKSKMYRWIILDSHLIIYRITEKEVQVLRILHSKRSVAKIRATRSLKF